ncbi:MAG: FAD-binding oxidoreductase [Kordiimonadaceae bacterium]|jgi:gamma-glutamylputrescine oxidase|nr:FAD-binding oxidoreductase [Kordiimonadaceae bacterium]MBT6032039.1 FAD-binding oxidoreductase [Kordiimonadaceae bacterium]
MSNPYKRTGEKGEYIDSYYSRTLNVEKEFPELTDDITTSVCVIGGGMAGVATAQGLVDKGINPVLIEANRIAWGASGRNGSFCSSGYSLGTAKIAKKVGKDHARELCMLTNDALSLIKTRIGDRRELRGETDGLLEVSWFDERAAMEKSIEFMNDVMAVDYKFWSKEEIRDLYHSKRYYDGYMKPCAIQVHSLNYTCHSAQQAENGGARVYEKSPVTSVIKHGNGWKVITEKGTVIADQIVMCCSAYIGNLDFKLSAATLPVATYVLLTEPLGERLKSAVEGPYGVSDNRFSSNYYRTLPDSRLFWGGRVSMFNPTGDKLKNIMMNDLLHVYPQLRGIKADVAWGGYMGYPVHKMPQIGELEPGFWYAQGFGGSGMTATVAGGEVVSDAIANGDERYKLFEPYGLQYAAKPFGPIVAQTAYWMFQAQDAFKSWRLNR